jgi:catechol 2,3-dioxygenase-like lactoylglutathione lyase family enzyme
MIHLGHPTLGANNLPAAIAFYDALFAPTGVTPLFEHPSGGRVYGRAGQIFFVVLAPIDGKPATTANGSMAGFRFDTPAEVDAFHARALTLGATDEGAPGYRAPTYYFSYLRDPEGHKLCAYCVTWPGAPGP